MITSNLGYGEGHSKCGVIVRFGNAEIRILALLSPLMERTTDFKKHRTYYTVIVPYATEINLLLTIPHYLFKVIQTLVSVARIDQQRKRMERYSLLTTLITTDC